MNLPSLPLPDPDPDLSLTRQRGGTKRHVRHKGIVLSLSCPCPVSSAQLAWPGHYLLLDPPRLHLSVAARVPKVPYLPRYTVVLTFKIRLKHRISNIESNMELATLP